jgi:hypothetical protein
MSRIYINAVHTSNFVGRVILKVKRTKESALIQVQSINLVTGRCDDSVTRGVMVGNCSTGFWYARAVVEPTLVVQGN